MLLRSCKDENCDQSVTPYTKRCLKEEVGAGRSSSGHCKVEHFAGWLGPAKMRASAPGACVGRETRFGVKYGIK